MSNINVKVNVQSLETPKKTNFIGSFSSTCNNCWSTHFYVKLPTLDSVDHNKNTLTRT